MQCGLVELFLPATARNTALVLEQLALRSEMETICYRCMLYVEMVDAVIR